MVAIPDNLGDGGAGLSRGQQIRTTAGDVYLKSILSEMNTALTTAESDIDDLETSVGTNTTDIGTLQTDVDTLQEQILAVHPAPVTMAAALALGEDDRTGFLFVTSTLFGAGLYQWNAASTINDSTGQLGIRPTGVDSGDPGRWDRIDRSFALAVSVDYQTAHDAVLYTVPTGVRLLLVGRPFGAISASFVSAGGANLGMSSSNAAYATDGDLFGGATGSAADALTAGIRGGTIGTAVDSQGLVVLDAGDTIKLDLFTSTFEEGAGIWHFPVMRA